VSVAKTGVENRENLVPARNLRLPITIHAIGSIAVCGDFCVIVGLSLVAGIAYDQLIRAGTPDLWRYGVIGVLSFVNFAAVGRARHFYDGTALRSTRGQFRRLTTSWVLVVSVLLGLAFAAKVGDDLSRGATFLFMIAAWGGLLGWRRLLTWCVARGSAAGYFSPRPIVLIADQAELAHANVVDDLAEAGYSAIHVVTFDDRTAPRDLRLRLDEAVELAQRRPVANLFLLAPWHSARKIEEIARSLEILPLPLFLLQDRNIAPFMRRTALMVGGAAAIELNRPPLSVSERVAKRAFDVVVATSGLILLSPMLLMTAVMVKMTSPGRILFHQTRNGFNGRAFKIVKFRTMTVVEDGPEIKQATRDDARVTPVGRWLRKTSIDELPQLWNVLVGHMSIVGPRPHAAAHNRTYEKQIASYAYRQHVKPGLTGWAQVHGLRGETRTIDQMRRRVEFDLHYINRWSFWLDIRIIWMTLKLAFRDPAAF
jgi:undecaprenyl-phosphate galactose phosphotransferase/putative colanic acid biosynthesis UDP-glucose lipid carrier transferase